MPQWLNTRDAAERLRKQRLKPHKGPELKTMTKKQIADRDAHGVTRRYTQREINFLMNKPTDKENHPNPFYQPRINRIPRHERRH